MNQFPNTEDLGDPFAEKASKSPLKSKGFTGSGGATILSAAFTVYTLWQSSGQIPQQEAISLISLVILSAIGWWGRIDAKHPIKFWNK